MHTLFSQSERSHTNLDAYDGEGGGMEVEASVGSCIGQDYLAELSRSGLDSQEAEWAGKYIKWRDIVSKGVDEKASVGKSIHLGRLYLFLSFAHLTCIY